MILSLVSVRSDPVILLSVRIVPFVLGTVKIVLVVKVTVRSVPVAILNNKKLDYRHTTILLIGLECRNTASRLIGIDDHHTVSWSIDIQSQGLIYNPHLQKCSSLFTGGLDRSSTKAQLVSYKNKQKQKNKKNRHARFYSKIFVDYRKINENHWN